jgi:hypothetical protein
MQQTLLTDALGYVAAGLVFAASSGFPIHGNAALPPNATPDPELQAWFQSLKQPLTGQPCCSISDCRFASFHMRGGHYEIEIDQWTYVVPDQAILHPAPNPTGKAVVCYSYDSGPLEVMEDSLRISCFVPPETLS